MRVGLIAFLLLLSVKIFAQERKIVGRVLDADSRKPIENVMVTIEDIASGTFSNRFGYFELIVDSSKQKSMIVACIGYKTSTLGIPKTDKFQFTLSKDFLPLNQLNLNDYPTKQTDQVKKQTQEVSPDTTAIAIDARFPGGMEAFYDFVGNGLSMVSEFKDKRVNTTFTINETGLVTNISVSDSSFIVKMSIAAVFQRMPNWVPAKQKQHKVSQYFILPISKPGLLNAQTPEMKPFYAFVTKNIKYPQQARRMGIDGEVLIVFQADDAGNIINIIVLRDIGGDCGDEVKRALARVPLDMIKSIMDKTSYHFFNMSVCFGFEKPFKGKPMPKTNAFNLEPIQITAFGESAPTR